MARSTEERLFSRLEESLSGCWLWTGPLDVGGYSKIGSEGRFVFAHRWSYEFFRGPIPDGLFLDHLCRVRHCMNPDHLEPVTTKVNLNRGVNKESRKTHCPSGHEYSAENTYVHKRGDRQCRTCHRTRESERQKRLRREARAK